MIFLSSLRLIAVDDEIKSTKGDEVTFEYGTCANRFDINVLYTGSSVLYMGVRIVLNDSCHA